jgi:multidrug efflux pump subunit AcrA (membrane-fusion protein)
MPAQHASHDLGGRKVRLQVTTSTDKTQEFPGKIVFINPEIDPLNSQVRFWAEVENQGLKLRPGMQATLTIDPR